MFGISYTARNIRVMISSKRPHEKGWKIVHLLPELYEGAKIVSVGKGKNKFDTLFEHRKLFELAGTSTGWIKVIEA